LHFASVIAANAVIHGGMQPAPPTSRYMSPLLKTLGALASRAWIDRLGIAGPFDGWFVEIQLRADVPEVRFELNVYPEEWGFVFRVGKKVSSIRITDVPFVHGVDELKLLQRTPTLDALPGFLASLQTAHAMQFDGARATVHTNLDESRVAAAVQRWLEPAR